ncbi:hypothetical protein WHT83_03065 [Aminobacter sp. P9b]|uniref:Uncharacterized protein n=1 Tax=Aminobacter niigataensis TaxID=83265 RepID=A0ABR6L278_9HYPH|nr:MULTISPECIES: hypothetical protein [Aminobacter]AWC21712.1 hypothetical protein CO731_01164 [Aminobacter sp. MSH1]MBB4650876.1 hypothetical protein [Aminobacter niigataensis]CAI2932433.1 conserved protein of unknown function [Aminobacter niigataensis]
MPDEAVHMQQIGESPVEQPAHQQPSYWGRALGKAWAYVTLTGSPSQQDQPADGLEAFDMLGGWKGPDARRRNIG